MGLILRYFLIVTTVFASLVVAIDDADARRFRWRSSGSRSVTVPTSVPTTGAAGAAGAAVVATGAITLVHNMPDTTDFSYGNGYFDVGFRETEDGKGEYVIYQGDLASPLKPELQKGIAEMVGYDPVERHKASRKAAVSTSAVSAKDEDASQGFLGPFNIPWAVIIFLALAGGAALYRKLKRTIYEVNRPGMGTNAPDMEERINARLRELRAQQ